MLKISTLAVLTVTLLCGCASQRDLHGQIPKVRHSQVSSVTVEGILLVGEFLGPPNYGENPESDRIEHPYFLQLPAPLVTQSPYNSLSSFGPDAGTEYFVQLVVYDKERPQTEKLIGKKVKVVGPAFEARTGHDRTSILIEVQSISPIEEWRW